VAPSALDSIAPSVERRAAQHRLDHRGNREDIATSRAWPLPDGLREGAARQLADRLSQTAVLGGMPPQLVIGIIPSLIRHGEIL
jgi:hypothetical protein